MTARILHLEDNPADQVIIQRALRRTGIEHVYISTDARASFIDSLNSSRPDLVLSDYELPDIRGDEALRISKSLYYDVPVIFVSGRIGEDRAIELLHSGATDYVLKDNLIRLGSAVRRALGDSKQAAYLKDVERHLREKEDQLVQSQKMEALGQLAGGVAHDFNNLLAVILSNAELIKKVSVGENIQGEISEIIDTSLRGKALVQQLLLFSKSDTRDAEVVDLNRLIKSMKSILNRVLENRIRIEIKLLAENPNVYADPHRLEQVILNLAINARDAMPSGGKLTIETRTQETDSSSEAEQNWPSCGLIVSDTGHGMDEATRSQIFTPFFSTKGDKGTGLGLATVYAIIQQHGGAIDVESAPGKGTSFEVFLPCADGDEKAEVIQAEKTTAQGGSEKLLLVDDAPRIRSVVARLLRSYGYDVVEAELAAEALNHLQHNNGISLVITDHEMPEMNGADLIARLRETHPGIKTILMTGHAENLVSDSGVQADGFLGKPFTSEELGQVVREILDDSGGAG